MSILSNELDDYISELVFEFRDVSIPEDRLCFHLDYVQKVYRDEDLARLIGDAVPYFALTPEEFAKYAQGELISNKRKAWSRISKAMAEKKGDYGELLLYLLLSNKIKPAVPRFVTKVRLRSSTSTQIHGFDCAHFTLENDELCLWLGEAKFHQNISSGIADAIKSLKDHCEAGYLTEELKILGANIEANNKITHTDLAELEKALTKGRSLDRINFKIPVLLTYDSSTVKNHTEICLDFKNEIKAEVLKHIETWAKSMDALPNNFSIILLFVPLRSVKSIKAKLSAIEEGNR